MPRLTSSLPKYRLHRASGQAAVTLYGRDFYLGPWQSKASRLEYDRLIGEWVAAGRPSLPPTQQSDIAIVELAAAYRKFAEGYYRKNGRQTDTIYQVRLATKLLCEKYGRTAAGAFGPLAFKAFQADLIAGGLSRKSINHLLSTIRRMFRWAVGEELVTVAVLQALQAVPNVPKGRTAAKERPPVRPVEDAVVDATLPYLPVVVADMIRVQRLTGARPGEVCILRPCDLDTTGEIWSYRPGEHKTEHHDLERVVVLGPKAQEVLRPYLLRDKASYCFVPAESERKRNTERRENRRSPMTPSQAARQPQRNRRRPAGSLYTVDAYRRAITRAIERANADRKEKGEEPLPRWHPNQLRHNVGTVLRKKYGLEGAQVILGHSHADVTQVYAERDMQRAREIARDVG
jgi:integrase